MAVGRFELPQLSSVIYTHHLRPTAFLQSRKYLPVKRFAAVFNVTWTHVYRNLKPVKLFAVCRAECLVPRQVCVFSIRILKLFFFFPYKSAEHLFWAVMHPDAGLMQGLMCFIVPLIAVEQKAVFSSYQGCLLCKRFTGKIFCGEQRQPLQRVTGAVTSRLSSASEQSCLGALL